jgi:hypothetical protein
MISFSSVILRLHLIGLALGIGAATVKLALVVKCNTDYTFVPYYNKVSKPITGFIVLGVMLLTFSGIIWLIQGYPFTLRLIIKLVLVSAIWGFGMFIDNVIEPKFHKLSPISDQPASPEFVRIQKKHLALEIIATVIFYAVIVYWVLT